MFICVCVCVQRQCDDVCIMGACKEGGQKESQNARRIKRMEEECIMGMFFDIEYVGVFKQYQRVRSCQ